MTALDRIYENLQNGGVYGEMLVNVRFPCFWPVLWKHGKYLDWRHFGSSANDNTKHDLAWIIREIFRMSPGEFETKYELR